MFGAFIATRTKQPLLALDGEEAKAIADSAANVGKHYNIPISPVAQAWVGFIGTVGSIYFAKLAVIRAMKKAPDHVAA